MKAIIEPSTARGTTEAPPSKSMAHRLLICAGLSEKESVIENVALSQDVLATLDCLKALGADWSFADGTVRLSGASLDGDLSGIILNCRECGSTLRFFIPIALLLDTPVRFTGSETLLKRPLGAYEKLCADKGFIFRRDESGITVSGRLAPDEYEMSGDISSQFISGMMFALARAGGRSVIRITKPIESGPYIDMTIQALRAFGADVTRVSEGLIEIGGGGYAPQRTRVEGDYSNAAFLEALNIAGGDVRVMGLKKDSLQGDKAYAGFFDEIERGFARIDIADCPDLGPILMAAAAMKHGAELTGTRRLKIKESDRGEAMRLELAKFGIGVDVKEDSITVRKGSLTRPRTELFGHNDHRIVMSLAVLATVTGGVIEQAQAVKKSFPDFFEKLAALGVEVKTDGMDK